mgnify:FL=1
MKKLLLILICLFVTFEVNSESDDFSDKKLSCDDSVSINELFSMIGFDFSSKEMTFYQLRTTTGILNTFKGKYKTNPKKITFSFSGLDNFLLELDRNDLTVNLQGDDSPLYKCEVLDEDIEIYFKNLQTKIKNEFK